MSGAVRNCASACSSIECASVRYFVSWAWRSVVISSLRPLGSCLPSLPARAAPESIAIDPDQPLVADPEVVRELVERNAPHFAAQPLHVAAVQAQERPAVDRDLVGQDTAVLAAAPRQRYPLVQPEQRTARG